MKEFEYTLKKGDKDMPMPYKGKVKLKVVSFLERNEMMKKVNFKIDQTNVELSDNLDAASRMSEVVKDNILSLEVFKGKKKFETLEELDFDCDVAAFYVEVGTVLLRGIDLGKY